MTRTLKFAAAIVVTVVLAVPSFAALACGGVGLPTLAQSPHMCCPSQSFSMAASQIAVRHVGLPCCNISQDSSAPVAAVQRETAPAADTAQSSSIASYLAEEGAKAPLGLLRPLHYSGSFQSLLCIFLI